MTTRGFPFSRVVEINSNYRVVVEGFSAYVDSEVSWFNIFEAFSVFKVSALIFSAIVF